MQKGLSAADPSLSRGGTACSLLSLKSFKSYTLGHLNYRLLKDMVLRKKENIPLYLYYYYSVAFVSGIRLYLGKKFIFLLGQEVYSLFIHHAFDAICKYIENIQDLEIIYILPFHLYHFILLPSENSLCNLSKSASSELFLNFRMIFRWNIYSSPSIIFVFLV